MDLAFWFLWGATGWCGTPWRRWPPPRPEPDPWWWRVIGVVGGLVGGWAYSSVWAQEGSGLALYAAATSVGALIGSAILQDIAGMARGAGKAG